METLISMFLINMVIFGTFLTISFLHKSSQKNIDTSSGYIVASSLLKSYIMEFKRGTRQDSVEDKTTVGERDYYYKITVEPNPAAASPDTLYRITIVTSWREASSDGKIKELSAELATVVHRDNPWK